MHDAAEKAYCKLRLPPKMDHNDLDFQTDFIQPLTEFFKETRI
jgi:hypothetical protein